MALNTAFAAALNPAKMDEVRIWYLKGAYAKMDVKSVADLIAAGDHLKNPAPGLPGAPQDEDDVAEPAEPSIGLLSGSVGFGKATTPTSVRIPSSVRQS